MTRDRSLDDALVAAVAESGANPAETAAIVAAVRAHLEEEAVARDARGDDGDDEGSSGWQGRRWAFAGRIDSLGGRSVRVPESAPEDAWSASGRTDRF